MCNRLWLIVPLALLVSGSSMGRLPSNSSAFGGGKVDDRLYQMTLIRNIGGMRTLLSAGADVNEVTYGVTPLQTAIKEGCADAVNLLIEAGADVNMTTPEERTPLSLACCNGEYYRDIVRLLLDAGADVNKVDRYGYPLLAAASNGQLEVAELLLSKGATLTGEACVHLLYWAVAYGAASMVSYLLGLGVEFNITDNQGRSLLYIAARNGRVNIVKLLVKAGMDPNEVATLGDGSVTTPLFVAAQCGHVEVVRFLLNVGAKIHGKFRPLDLAIASADVLVSVGEECGSGRTPLHYAALNGCAKTAQRLISLRADLDAVSNDGDTPLLCAAANGNSEVVKSLLAAGADVHKVAQNCWKPATFNGFPQLFEGVFSEGATPLLCAAARGSIEIVASLLAAGADANQAGSDGLTPFYYAVCKGHLEVAQLLSSQRPDLAVSDCNGMTALHWASRRNYVGLATMLLFAGADVNATDKDGHTPLHCAPHAEIAGALIAAGADVNAVDHLGWTPLHHAASFGSNGLVRSLITFGANVTATDQRGLTPLHLAVEAGKTETVELLLSTNADVNGADNDGRTALHFAFGRYDVGIIEQLIAAGADMHAVDNNGKHH